MTKRSSSRKKSTRRRKRKKKEPFSISLDAQLDILGGVLLGVGGITILALMSLQRGALLGPWIDWLSRLFGWGVYIVPFFIGAAGLYLLLRRFGDRVPRPRPEQAVGILILFVAFLATVHFPAAWLSGQDPYAVAEAGHGGGYLGVGLATFLAQGLGSAGAVLALAATWLLGVFFAFGVSPAEIVRRLIEWGKQLRLRYRPVQLPLPLRTNRDAKPSAPERRAPPTVNVGTVSRTPVATAAPMPSRVIGGVSWDLPPLEAILEVGDEQDLNQEFVRQQARIIEETLESLGAPVVVKEINRGPVITQFGVEPLSVRNRRGEDDRHLTGGRNIL